MRHNVLLVLVGLAAVLAVAAPAAARDGQLEGTKISLLPPGGTQTVPASEATYIRHCWVPSMDQWQSFTGAQRRSLLDDALWYFEAEADGTPLGLTKSFHRGTSLDGLASMLKCWFVEIPANTFSAGQTVVFTGRLVADQDFDGVAEFVFEVDRTVTFT